MGMRIFVQAVLILCFSLTGIPGFGQPVKEQTTIPPAVSPPSKAGRSTTEFKAAETAPKPTPVKRKKRPKTSAKKKKAKAKKPTKAVTTPPAEKQLLSLPQNK